MIENNKYIKYYSAEAAGAELPVAYFLGVVKMAFSRSRILRSWMTAEQALNVRYFGYFNMHYIQSKIDESHSKICLYTSVCSPYWNL